MEQPNVPVRIIPLVEAALRAGISVSSVKRQARDGRFPRIVNRGFRGKGCVESELDAYLENATKHLNGNSDLSPKVRELRERLTATRARARSNREQAEPHERACIDALADIARATEAVSRNDISRRGAEFATKRLDGASSDDATNEARADQKAEEQRTTDVLCAKAREAAVALPYLEVARDERRANHAAILNEERQILCDLISCLASERLRDGIAAAKDSLEMCVEAYVIARFSSLFMAGSVHEMLRPLYGGKDRQIPSWVVQQINWSIPTYRLLENDETLPGQRDITGAQIITVDAKACQEMTQDILREFGELGIEIPEEHRSWP